MSTKQNQNNINVAKGAVKRYLATSNAILTLVDILLNAVTKNATLGGFVVAELIKTFLRDELQNKFCERC